MQTIINIFTVIYSLEISKCTTPCCRICCAIIIALRNDSRQLAFIDVHTKIYIHLIQYVYESAHWRLRGCGCFHSNSREPISEPLTLERAFAGLDRFEWKQDHSICYHAMWISSGEIQNVSRKHLKGHLKKTGPKRLNVYCNNSSIDTYR